MTSGAEGSLGTQRSEPCEWPKMNSSSIPYGANSSVLNSFLSFPLPKLGKCQLKKKVFFVSGNCVS